MTAPADLWLRTPIRIAGAVDIVLALMIWGVW